MLASGAALPAFAEKTNQGSDKASTAESEVEPSGKTEKTTDPGKENASSGKSETSSAEKPESASSSRSETTGKGPAGREVSDKEGSDMDSSTDIEIPSAEDSSEKASSSSTDEAPAKTFAPRRGPAAGGTPTATGEENGILLPGTVSNNDGSPSSGFLRAVCRGLGAKEYEGLGIKPSDIKSITFKKVDSIPAGTTKVMSREDTDKSGTKHNSTVPIAAGFDQETETLTLYSTSDTIMANHVSDYLFYDVSDGALENLSTIDALSNIDFSRVNTARGMFYNTQSLKNIDLSKFDSASLTGNDVRAMFAKAGAESLTFGTDWRFFGDSYPSGITSNWKKSGTNEIYSSYDLEALTGDISGTYTKTSEEQNTKANAETGKIFQAYGAEIGNIWDVYALDDVSTGFCINADEDLPYGYYTREEIGSAADLDSYWTNTQKNEQAEMLKNTTLGSNMREVLIALLYYGVYSKDAKYPDLLNAASLAKGTDAYEKACREYEQFRDDIWHFTDPNHKSENTFDSSYWGSKKFSDIPNNDYLKLYAYKSMSAFKDGTQNMITIRSLAIPHAVSIKKTDITGTTEIAGAVLSVESTDGRATKYQNSFTTNGKDENTLMLIPGSYSLTETTAPKGYKSAETIYFVVKDDGSVATTSQDGKNEKTMQDSTILMKDDFAEHTILIRKTDVGGKEIAGAKLTVSGITDAGETFNETFETDGKTDHAVQVKPGKYSLTEETAPDGYVKAETIYFSVDLEGTVALTDKDGVVLGEKTDSISVQGKNVPLITMKDDYLKRKVVIKKSDIAGKEIKGATLIIDSDDGREPAYQRTFSTDGVHAHVFSLLPGDYRLTEKSAPEGYEKAETIYFSVDSNGKVITRDGEGKTLKSGEDTEYRRSNGEVYGLVVMVDEYSSKKGVQISKTDVGGTEIEGAKLTVTNKKTSETVDTWTSEKKPHVIGNLESGTYVLHETAAPNGYIVTNDVVFTVGENGSVKVDGKDVKGTVTMVDEKTRVTVRKVDSADNTKQLSGAKMQVLDSKGSVVDEWTTNGSEHVIEGVLAVGASYTLHEKEAPNGYKTASDISFTVDKTAKTIVMKDVAGKTDRTPGKVTVKKVDADDDTRFVTGARLQILGSDGNEIVSWTTDSSAHEIPASVFTYGKTYTLREASAPNGYSRANDISFTADEKNKTIIMKDKKTETEKNTPDQYIRVRVRKVSARDNSIALSGAHIQLLDENMKVVDEWTTDGTEYVLYNKVKQNHSYTLHETSAPNGYMVTDDVHFSAADKNLIIIMKDAPTGTPQMSTTNASNNTTSSPTNEIRTWSTGDSSRAGLFTAIAVAGLAVIAGTVVWLRKKKH